MEESLNHLMAQHGIDEEISSIISKENLLPIGLLERLHANYPHHSGIKARSKLLFQSKKRYTGLKGFRNIVETLNKAGVDIGHIEERELFIKVYRFMVTRHVLNSINWQNFEKDSLFQLVFPQPGMIKPEVFKKYVEAETDNDKEAIISKYIQSNTNPHDGNQKLNKPWFVDENGKLVILEGSQHKYMPCQLIFDKSTQNCFSFCTYCFRHAQVRGDDDMFIQEDISAVHGYLKKNKGVSDLLLTGGDGGLMPYERLRAYAGSLVSDPDLKHIVTLRIGSRALTFDPELILTKRYQPYLDLFKNLCENGVQVVWMSHFSTPGEVLNPMTIAAIRRLRLYGVVVKSQSPIMNHISLFTDKNGVTDIDRSAQNWIDLGNILAMLSVGFHSMYCARPTGEHHYFTVPLADINKVFNKIYRTLSSINRPSRYITMTSSAGKTSILGTVEVNGEKAFALKFNESRNMEWMDQVYLAKFDEHENTVIKLKPFEGEKFFYEEELEQIERNKLESLEKRMHVE